MEKQVIEFVIKTIGASGKPDFEKAAQTTSEFCGKNGLKYEISAKDIAEIHEIVELFDDPEIALIHLSTLSDDITDVSIPFRSLKEKGIQKVESRMQELELFRVIYDAANPINRITSYCIVKASSRAKMELEIMKRLETGWKPYGGIAIAAANGSSNGDSNYIQAMVRFNPGFDQDDTGDMGS